MKTIFRFDKKTAKIVGDLNKIFLQKGKLSTHPDLLLFHSYDSYDIENDKTPIDSVCRYTIQGLKHIFPLIKIELGVSNEIIVEDKILENYSVIPNKIHDDYIKEIMLDIFILYQHDENKIPKKYYGWYFKK